MVFFSAQIFNQLLCNDTLSDRPVVHETSIQAQVSVLTLSLRPTNAVQAQEEKVDYKSVASSQSTFQKNK